MRIRKQFSKEFKAKVGLEALRGEKTLAQLCSQYSLQSSQITLWKKTIREGLPELFSRRKSRDEQERQELVEELYKNIGQLKMENDWLKKKLHL
jgi:putative transposase